MQLKKRNNMKLMACTIMMVISGSLFKSCDKNDDNNSANVPDNAKVIVIGAGASGLHAGKILNDNNIDFTILEASNTVGGRLKKNSTFTDFPLDMGAEWIHGNQALTHQWATSQGIDIYEDASNDSYWYNNQIYTEETIPEAFYPFLGYIMFDALGDTDQSLKDWAISNGYGEDTYPLMEASVNGLGGSADNTSIPNALAEQENWSSGENDYKFKNQTYFDLIHNILVPQIEENIILNAPVTKIDYTNDKVIVTAGGSTYEADKVIVTVPLKILQAEYIEFVPALSSNKQQAINAIGMEAGMKVYLKFNTNFFEDQNISGGSVGPYYYDAGHGKPSNVPILGLFVTGTNAQELSDMEEPDAIAAILAELDMIYNGQATTNYTGEYIMQDWAKEPFVGGAYSYATVGMGNAREVLAEPINNKVFFAGEATHQNGHNSTVQGALETGEREAINVINSF